MRNNYEKIKANSIKWLKKPLGKIKKANTVYESKVNISSLTYK